MACRSACKTQDHSTWGECARAASLKIGYSNSANGWDASTQKRWDKELQLYRDVRATGIQPAGTSTKQIREAMDISEKANSAFDASTNKFANGAHYSPKTGKAVML
jgi:hypothetical protein